MVMPGRMLVPPSAASASMRDLIVCEAPFLTMGTTIRGRVSKAVTGDVVGVGEDVEGSHGGGFGHGEFFAVHRAGAIDDQRQRPDGANFEILDLAIDGERFFERGMCPTAGAEAIGAAEHDQAGAELLRIGDE